MAFSILSFLLSLLLLSVSALAKDPRIHQLPPLREQAKIQDGWLQQRLDTIPSILQRHGVDAWLVSNQSLHPYYAILTLSRSLKKSMPKIPPFGP